MMISKMIKRKKDLKISKMAGLSLNGLKWSLLIKKLIRKMRKTIMIRMISVDGQHLPSNNKTAQKLQISKKITN